VPEGSTDPEGEHISKRCKLVVPKRLRYWANGEWCESKTTEYMNCYDPSTGEVIAQAPQCTGDEVNATAAANGKRVQCLTEAKNHALVMKDAALDRAVQGGMGGDCGCEKSAALERTARGILNSACGCASERCMALSVVVAEEEIADSLVAMLATVMKELKIGPAYDKTSYLGPVVNAEHKKFVSDWIQKGVEEGAKRVLNGRNVTVKGMKRAFMLDRHSSTTSSSACRWPTGRFSGRFCASSG
jgi:acyl-CoA reductase-like NAD-dependent aldehyde dehydrogenase